MIPRVTLGRVAITAAIACATFQAASGQAPLTLVDAIGLLNVEGRIDHLAVDEEAQRLYVAALGNNTVEVLDLKGSRHVKSVPGFREPQGIAVAAGEKVVAAANGQVRL
jgi:YVTN family beta-propeller protein